MSEASPRDDQRCPFLGVIGAGFAAVSAALILHGGTLSGERSPWFDCLVISLLIPVMTSAAGRSAGRYAYSLTAVACLISMGLAEAITATVSPQRLTLTVLDGLLYALTPVAAVLLMRRFGGRWVAALATGLEKRPIERTSRFGGTAPAWWLTAWVAVVCGVFLLGASTDRTGFRMITVPYDEFHGDLSLLGFSVLVDQHPVMAETMPAVEQVGWFAGAVRSDNNFRFLRAGYSFLAAPSTVVFDQRMSLLIINYLAWLLCLVLVGRLSWRWFGCRLSAAVAVALAAAGVGFGVLINDTTPHVLSFALYYLGIYQIDRGRFGSQRQPWRLHLIFGLTLGMISLAYNVAQMLWFVYVLVSWRKQPLRSLITVTALSLVFRPLWARILPGMGINVREVEAEYLRRAVRYWTDSLRDGPLTLISDLAYYATESVTALESPWLLFAGIAGAWTLKGRDQKWLAGWAVVAPLLACVFFAPTSNSRGYIIYGASVMVYPAAGRLIGLGIRARRDIRAVSIAALLLLCAAQLAWTTSHYALSVAPAKSFLMGAIKAAPLFSGPPTITNLTGAEPLPKAFGGQASFAEAGMVDTPAEESLPLRLLPQAVLSRCFFLSGLLMLVWVRLDQRRARRWATAALVAWFVFTALVSFVRIDRQPFAFDQRGQRLDPGSKLVYSIDVKPELAEVFVGGGLDWPGGHCELYLGATDPVAVRWFADGDEIALQPPRGRRWLVEPETERRKIFAARRWRFEIRNTGTGPLFLRGWQRAGLAGRRVEPAADASVLPALEVRLREPRTGVLRAVAY